MADQEQDPQWTTGEAPLVDFFEVITAVAAPDLWSRIERQHERARMTGDGSAPETASDADRDDVVLLTSVLSPGFGLGRANDDDDSAIFRSEVVKPGLDTDRLGRRGRLVAAAVLFIAAVLVWAALAGGEDAATTPGDSDLSIDADDTSDSGLGDEGLEGGFGTDADGLPIASGGGCEARPGQPPAQPVSYAQTGSPAELIEQAPLAVRGTIISASTTGDGGGLITIRLQDLAGPERLGRDPFSTIRTPVVPPSGLVGASFVAVLDGDDVPARAFPDQIAGLVHPEGLWVSCEAGEPAVPALAAPAGAGWNVFLDDGGTLRDLWDEALYPGGGHTTPLRSPVTTDGGADIYDLRLQDRGRLRLALPPALATDFTVTEGPSPSPVSITGDGTMISIEFGPCPRRATELNLLGAEIGADNSGPGSSHRFDVCRSDEQLTASILTSRPLADEDVDRIDVRTIDIGEAQFGALVAGQVVAQPCLDCPPFGPVRFPDLGVLVRPIDGFRVAAIDLDDLSTVWVVETESEHIDLIADESSVYMSLADGHLLKLDPGTGRELWRLAPEAGERNALLNFAPDSTLLLRSTFAAPSTDEEGDEDEAEPSVGRAPVLRRVDTATGRVLWRAEGRPGTTWQTASPLVLDGLVFVLDINDAVVDTPLGGNTSADDPPAALQSFDLETGDRRWVTELGSRLLILDRDLIARMSFEAGQALLVRTVDGDVLRVNAETGAIAWRTPVPAGRFTGTSFAGNGTLAIDLRTPVGPVLLNPDTGAMLEPAAPDNFVCPVTQPPDVRFVPPDPWVEVPSGENVVWFGTDELWTVLEVGGHARRKNLFWSVNFGGGAVEPEPELAVTFTRLDPEPSDGGPTVVDFPPPGTNAFTEGDGDFMINGIEPEVGGCWQATAEYRKVQLRYVFELP